MFSRRTFVDCVQGAWTSQGVFLVNVDPYPFFRLRADDGVVDVNLLVSDVGQGGPILGFTGGEEDAEQFERRVSTLSNQANPHYALTDIVLRRRGNVVFFYPRSTPPDSVRIAESCLGGEPWESPPDGPPDVGFPPPDPVG